MEARSACPWEGAVARGSARVAPRRIREALAGAGARARSDTERPPE